MIGCKTMSLNDGWLIDKDENNVGLTAGYTRCPSPGAVKAFVPSIIQQFFPDFHGIAWYWCKFDTKLNVENEKVILKFGGVDYKADVWLNGISIGSYEGGETPFGFDVSEAVKESENVLAVRVVNPTERVIDGITLNGVPHRNKVINRQAGSCLNHGGIWYGVTLECEPNITVADLTYETNPYTGELKTTVTVGGEDYAPADVSVCVFDKISGSKISGATAIVTEASRTVTIVQTVACVVPWSVDNPHLYLVETAVRKDGVEHKRVQRLGFREFTVKDGYFYLNGKKLFLRSSHTGNAFPIGQMLPVANGQQRADLVLAKSCGFNMIRSIAGMLRPEQLELADELGLLIYEESFAAWCMGYSHWEEWSGKDGYEEMRRRRAQSDMDIGEESELLRRWSLSTSQMIQRDKNRTCVVVWGLLNETKRNSVFYNAVQYIKKLRQIDPTRVVMLNSGRFDCDFSIGSVSNPYSDEWEQAMGNDGVVADSRETAYRDEYGYVVSVHKTGDNHFYSSCPMTESVISKYRTLGFDSPKPVFLSEFGMGSQFDVIDEYNHFIQRGEREDLEDCAWLKYQADALKADWKRLGLERIYPFAEQFLKDSQKINADERRRNFDMLRSNNRLSGFSLTGLLDHGMCGEGLWTYWRKFKPGMYDAVSDGWASLRFCILAPVAVKVGEKIKIEIYLANDGVLKSGIYHADFAVNGPYGVENCFSADFELDGSDFSTFVTEKTVCPTRSGRYEVVARMDGGAPRGESRWFEAVDCSGEIDGEIECVGIDGEVKDLLVRHGIKSGKGPVLVGSVTAKEVDLLLKRAAEGETVAFLDSSQFTDGEKLRALQTVAPDLSLSLGRDWLYHKDFVLACGEVFDGLGKKILDPYVFGESFPHLAYKTSKTPYESLCPGFVTGNHNERDGYASYHALCSYRYGRGVVYLSAFPLKRSAVREKLLVGIVNKILSK